MAYLVFGWAFLACAVLCSAALRCCAVLCDGYVSRVELLSDHNAIPLQSAPFSVPCISLLYSALAFLFAALQSTFFSVRFIGLPYPSYDLHLAILCWFGFGFIEFQYLDIVCSLLT